jgi:RecA-family ATPase
MTTTINDVPPDGAEIPWRVSEAVASWHRTLAPMQGDKRQGWEWACCELLGLAQKYPDEPLTRRAIFDEVFAMSRDAGIDADEAQQFMSANLARCREDSVVQTNGHAEISGPSADDYSIEPVAPASFITPAAWPCEAPPPVDWLVAGRIPRGDVTTLHGDGGTGKTDIAIRLAANVARGAQDWLGHAVEAGRVVFISGEEPERDLRRRIWLHAERDFYSPETLTDLHLWLPGDDNDTVLATADRSSGVMRPTQLFDSIKAAIAAVAPVLVVVDSVAATFAGSQIDRTMARTFVNLWRAVARGPSAPAVLLLDHPSQAGLKDGSGRSGNMDWRNAVRSALYLYPAPDQADADRGVKILETMKSNYGPPGNPLRLLWADGGLQLEAAPTSLHRLAKDAECEETFLRLLDERNAQGGHVGRKTSGMYAPKVFAMTPDNGGFAKSAFASAMERLFAAGTIREVWDPKRRHDYIDRAVEAA